MLISELIEELQQAKYQRGDGEAMGWDDDRASAYDINRLVITDEEPKPAHDGYPEEAKPGEKVAVVLIY